MLCQKHEMATKFALIWDIFEVIKPPNKQINFVLIKTDNPLINWWKKFKLSSPVSSLPTNMNPFLTQINGDMGWDLLINVLHKGRWCWDLLLKDIAQRPASSPTAHEHREEYSREEIFWQLVFIALIGAKMEGWWLMVQEKKS